MLGPDLHADPDEVTWEDFASCAGVPPELADMFFDIYEEDAEMAKQADEICFSCPVIKNCYITGVKENRTGVWGGVYLTEGEIDVKMNRHKTDEVWDEWRRTTGFE